MTDENLKETVLQDLEDMKGRTFRCNNEDCSTSVALYPEGEEPSAEGIEYDAICEDCGEEFEQIHPADFILSNPLAEPKEEAIPILQEEAEEEHPEWW